MQDLVSMHKAIWRSRDFPIRTNQGLTEAGANGLPRRGTGPRTRSRTSAGDDLMRWKVSISLNFENKFEDATFKDFSFLEKLTRWIS